MDRIRTIIGAVCTTLASSGVAFANDSAAELSVGGLQFTRSTSVSMTSEELSISLQQIRVKYQFINTSSAPVTLTIAFPLPDVDLSEGENTAFPFNDPLNFVGFETRVDGNPVKFSVEQRAFTGDKEVTSVLRELNVPLLPLGAQQFRAQDLTPAVRARMVSEGLLMPAGSDERGRPLYASGWTVKTSVFREQTFPPGQPVNVEHTYRPSVGGSPDTILRKSLRQEKAMAKEVERYRRKYCVTDGFLQELDKMAGLSRSNTAMIQERRISYVLTTGANWAGPIKNFHLLIDKGSALVSYCDGKLNSSSKQILDVTANDFVPDRDLKLLFVGRF
jgi:Domain of unknown function (DUF4424)